MTLSPTSHLFYFVSGTEAQFNSFFNAEMFKSICKLRDRKRPLVTKLAVLITCPEIYMTAGQLCRKENNATLAFTSNPISPGSEYSLYGKIGVFLDTRLPLQ